MEEVHMLKYKEFLETIHFGDEQPKEIKLLGLLINNVYTILGAMGGNLKVNPQVRMFVENVIFLIDTLFESGQTVHAQTLKEIFEASDIQSKV